MSERTASPSAECSWRPGCAAQWVCQAVQTAVRTAVLCARPALLRAFFVGGCGASVGGELTLAIKGGKGDEGDPKQHAPRHKPPRHGPPGGYWASPAGVRPRVRSVRSLATRWPQARPAARPVSSCYESVNSTALKMGGRPCIYTYSTGTSIRTRSSISGYSKPDPATKFAPWIS
eukprot:COSAG05_NODE_834_length_7061_cov_10.700804_4_plen_175_part_00